MSASTGTANTQGIPLVRCRVRSAPRCPRRAMKTYNGNQSSASHPAGGAKRKRAHNNAARCSGCGAHRRKYPYLGSARTCIRMQASGMKDAVYR